MKFETDTQNVAILLSKDKHFTREAADRLVIAAKSAEITNLLSKDEVVTMINESTQAILDKSDARFEKIEARFERSFSRLYATIIGCSSVLVALLVALHLLH